MRLSDWIEAELNPLHRNQLVSPRVTMHRVRVCRRTGFAMRIGLACLVFLGASGNALTTIVCSQSRCGNSCGMHVSAPVKQAPRSCCADNGAKSQPQQPPPEKSCNCEL